MIDFLNNIILLCVDFLVGRDFIKKKVESKDAQKIIELYSKVLYTKNFVKFRFWFGPILELNEIVPRSGKILDVGSGEGILANFLAISSPKRKITGIEINKNRVKQADKKIKNIKFISSDIFNHKRRSDFDSVIVSHVFHHLGSREKQEKLLDIIYKILRKNGQLVIAEVDAGFNIRYFFGWIVDVLLVPIFFEKKFLDLQIYHRSRLEWFSLLRKHGFKIIYKKVTKDRVYPEVIIVARK